MKRSNFKIAVFSVGFLVCLMVFLYPTMSDLWNQRINSALIRDYDQSIQAIDESEFDRLWLQALEYNQRLSQGKATLPYETVLNPVGNGMMGYLEIPKIRVELPIYHSMDDSILQSNVGHMMDSALPVGGESTRCVLAGHTGLATAKLLSNLDQLQRGDTFRIKVLNRTLVYQVVSTIIVLPHETQYLKPLEGEDLLTLITCTPYGVNSHRLLVTGRRLNVEDVGEDMLILASDIEFVDVRQLIPAATLVAGLVCALYFAITNYLKQRGRKHET